MSLLINPYVSFGSGGHSGTGGSATQLIVDDFTRSDSTTNLGSASPGGAWTQDNGTWGISSNQAYISSGSGASIATIDASESDVDIRVKVSASAGGGNAGLVFRYSDANNYWRAFWDGSSGNIFLQKVVSGSGTTFVNTGVTGGFAAGDQIRVLASGSSIKLYHEGDRYGTVTDSHNSTATKHGLWINQATPTNWRLDDFRCQGLPATPTGTGSYSDDFNRADSDSLGSEWSTQLALIGITSNVVASRSPDQIEFGHSVLDTSLADATIQATVSALDTGGNAGIVFRWQDYLNFWVFFLSGNTNQVILQEFVAGASTTRGTAGITKTAGDVLKVIASGTSIQCYHQNTLQISYTSSLYQSSGIHGLWINRGNPSSWRLDDFSVV